MSIKFENRIKEKQIKSVNGILENKFVQISEDECKKLCDKIKLKYLPGYENRIIERITTTETPDRDGDIVRCKGIDNKNYRMNPVVLFAHNKSDFPVGRSIKEWIDEFIKGWRSWDLYLDNTVDTTGKSDLVFRMVNAGAMTGGSIGFLPKANGFKCNHTEEEKRILGLGKYGVEYLAVEKIEHSVCSVPANAEALSLSLKSLDKNIIFNQLQKSDLDLMEKHQIIDNNLINVFSDLFSGEKIISIPKEIECNDEICETCKEPVDLNCVLKPYPNEHACRLIEPNEFESFFRKKVKDNNDIGNYIHTGKTYDLIIGYRKDKSSDILANRYPKDIWTVEEARKHCKAHKGILFEPASEKKSLESEGESVIINIDMNKTIEEITLLNEKMNEFNKNIVDIEKSITEKFKSLMEIADKTITIIKQIDNEKSVFDRKDIENILKI